MPIIEFPCPFCHTTVKAPDQAAGKAARCPECRKKCVVPDPFPENAPFDFQQLTVPETTGREDESIICPSLRRSHSYYVLVLLLSGSLVLVVAFLGMMYLRRQRLEDHFEARYQTLCHRERELIDRSERLYHQMTETKDPKAQRTLHSDIQLAHIELEDVYAQMQGILHDRIASNAGRPGDHYRLEKIAGQRENLKSLRQSLDDWFNLKEIQKSIRDANRP